MAKICPVCNEKINFGELWSIHDVDGFGIHDKDCILKYRENPEKYGGKGTEAQKKTESQRVEQQQKIEDKSVYVKDGSIHVKSFDMPFGDMVVFMIKWALASIPAFIILALIGAIFFAIFGALFF